MNKEKMTLTKLARQMNARFDNLESDVKDIKTRLGKVEMRLDGVDARLDGIDARLDGIDARLDYIVEANNLKDNK